MWADEKNAAIAGRDNLRRATLSGERLGPQALPRRVPAVQRTILKYVSPCRAPKPLFSTVLIKVSAVLMLAGGLVLLYGASWSLLII